MGDPFVRPGVHCDRYSELVLRNPGTGHADTTKHDWMTQLHRDGLAETLHHHDQLLHLSVAENVSVSRLRYSLFDKMVEPCGPPPQPVKRARPAGEDEDAEAAPSA